MFLSRHASFRFWITVYAFPALLPLIMSIVSTLLLRTQLIAALGTQGAILASRISGALLVTLAILIVLANAMALWHQTTCKPALPRIPNRDGPNLTFMTTG